MKETDFKSYIDSDRNPWKKKGFNRDQFVIKLNMTDEVSNEDLEETPQRS